MTDILYSDPFKPSVEAVVAAALVIKAGGIVVIPTDTVYCIAADLGNAAAIQRLYGLKERRPGKALPVLIGDKAQLDLLAADIPPETGILMDYYWPGPLTIIFKKKKTVPDIATGGLTTVAIRQPGYVVCQGVLQELGSPLASSSANISGEKPARAVADISPKIIAGVDIVVDGGVCPRGVPSTILDVSAPIWRVLRQGNVTREAIETAVGRVIE